MIWMDGKLKVLVHFYGKCYFRECDKNGYPLKKKHYNNVIPWMITRDIWPRKTYKKIS